MAENQSPQRDPDVVVYSAFKGLRNDVTPERFSVEDLAVANNCDLDRSGRLARRAGFTRKYSGAAHSLWADDAQTTCLFAVGSQLMRLNADYSATPLAPLAGVQERLSYVKVNDNVYFSNGTDSGVLQNGAVRSWGLPVPPVPGVALTVGLLPAGTYQFALTYLRNDGQESGAPLAGTAVVPAQGGLQFTLPVCSDPSVVAKWLYLSTPNGDEMYQALLLPNAALTAAYTGDASELSMPLQTQFMGPPPAGQMVAYYRGHTFVAVGDTLYPSESLGYELFDLRNYIQLDGRITLLATMEDKEIRTFGGQHSGFFVGTDRSCGVLVGGGTDEFQYVPKVNYGAVPGALDYVDGSVFGDNSLGARLLPMWLTTQGLCVGKPDMEIANLTRTKYGFAAGGQGAALFMPGPNRFIATSNF